MTRENTSDIIKEHGTNYIFSIIFPLKSKGKNKKEIYKNINSDVPGDKATGKYFFILSYT